MMKLNVKNVLNFVNHDSHIDKRGYLHKKGEVRLGLENYSNYLNIMTVEIES